MPLERFKLTPPYPRETRVIGTHLFPIRLFGVGGGVGGAGFRTGDEDEVTRIIRTLDLDGTEVHISRMGGLFVRPPDAFSDYGDQVEPTPLEEKLRFESRAVVIFNLVVCELALEHVAAEPISTLDIGRGQLVDGHAVIGLQNLAPDPYRERTAAPYRELLKESDWWQRWWNTPEAVLDRIGAAERARQLSKLVASLPTTVSAAHYLFSRRLFAEAFAQAWAAADRIAERSGDTGPEIARDAQGSREEVSRGAEVTPETAMAAMRCMTSGIAHVCGTPVAEPEMPRRRAVW